jgi:hypothetical protein
MSQLVALRCCPSQSWEVSFPTLKDHDPDCNRNEMNLLRYLWLFTPSFLARSNQNRLFLNKQPLMRFPKTAPSSTTSSESTPNPQFPGSLRQKVLQLLSLVPPLRFRTSLTAYASYALPVSCTWLSILGFTTFPLPRSRIPDVYFLPFKAFHPLAASPSKFPAVASGSCHRTRLSRDDAFTRNLPFPIFPLCPYVSAGTSS